MIFKLFGKKPPAPAPKASEKPKAAAKPSQKPASSDKSPPGKVSRGPRTVAPVRMARPPGMAAPAAPKPAAPKPAETDPKPAAIDSHSGFEQGFDDDLGGSIQVSDGVGLEPAVEEAAILYANGSDTLAERVLKAALMQPGSGEQGYRLLFELYLLQGKQAPFEELALNYASAFEKSPPAWQDLSDGEVSPVLSTGGQSFVALGPRLDEKLGLQLSQFDRLISEHGMARLDLAKVEAVEAQGANLLLHALRAARKHSECQLVITGGEHFMPLLKSVIEVGRREAEPVWLLLLEVMSRLGLQEEFEEMSIDYAVTFEVSPPAWDAEPVVVRAAPAQDPAREEVADAPPADPDSWFLDGPVIGATAASFADMRDFAARRNRVVLDFSAVPRVDFVSAGTLLNEITGLLKTGKQLAVAGANPLVAALFDTVGISTLLPVGVRQRV